MCVILSSCDNAKVSAFKVMDSKSLEPLPLVSVLTKDTSFFSNDNGFFYLKSEQDLSINISYLGYFSKDTVLKKMEDDIIMIYLKEKIDFDTIKVREIDW